MSPNEKDIINTYLNHARGVLSSVFSQAFLSAFNLDLCETLA